MLVFGLSFKGALNHKMDVIHFLSDDDGIVGVFPRCLQRNVGIVHLAQEFRDVETDVVVDAVERVGTCFGELVAVKLYFFPIENDFRKASQFQDLRHENRFPHQQTENWVEQGQLRFR